MKEGHHVHKDDAHLAAASQACRYDKVLLAQR
jgi:hypothetical protein